MFNLVLSGKTPFLYIDPLKQGLKLSFANEVIFNVNGFYT